MDPLTPRELEVTRLVARGLPDREVGRALGITLATVRNHQQNIRAKLNLPNRTKLTLYAIAAGIVEAPCGNG